MREAEKNSHRVDYLTLEQDFFFFYIAVMKDNALLQRECPCRDIALAASLGSYWHYHYDYIETRQTDKIQLNYYDYYESN